MMCVEANKAIIRRFYRQVLNQRRVEPVDRLLAADFVDLGAPPGQLPGREGFKATLRSFLEHYPDLRFCIDEQIAEDDRVATFFTVRGNLCHTPSGRDPAGTAHGSGLSIERIIGGKIVTSRLQFGVAGLPSQPGAWSG